MNTLRALVIAVLAVITAIFQIAFLSHLPFPLATVSFPLLAVAYGIVRDRPLFAVGWALVAGATLDLHGLLGFGAEMAALFAAFFAARFLFMRVLTNAGPAARFLLGAAAAIIHWFALAAIDGARVLFGSVPILIDLSAASLLAPVRQALVTGALLLVLLALDDAARRRFSRTFLSHAATPHAFS
ncbi:MAG TPA: hypothetical protein VL283_04965 [Candidatus Baltobacteraceae bacterium]|nr:hypothetical protein [Candidatus Baltobacteraceae bacterium]